MRTAVFLIVLCLVFSSATLLADDARLNIQATALFREQGGHLEQMVRVHIPGSVEPDATLVIDGPGYTLSRALSSLEKIAVGSLSLVSTQEALLFPVPEILQPTTVQARVRNGRQTLRGTFHLQPQRKWEIQVIHSTHTDVGYTDMAGRVRRQLVAQLRSVLSACRETDDFPPDAKFRWVVEAFLPLEDFWKEAAEAERREFLKYVREERIEVTAAYVPHLSDIAGHESLLRFFYPAARFAREHGLPFRSSMFTDSTGYAWVIPQILNTLGIRYLSTAVNPTRALNPFATLPRPIYWESPDGSRVLLWNSDPQMSYPEGYRLRLAHSYQAALPLLLAYLEKLQESGYRFADLGLRVAQDNQPPAVAISETIRDWNARWKYPHLVFSTNYQFLKTMEEHHGADIPTYRAAWPDWWSDMYLSDARATGVLRLAHEWLSAAEKLFALARLAKKDARLDLQSLNVARERMMLSDEPVWGLFEGTDRPQDWRTRGANSEKVFDIHTAAVNARAVANEAALSLLGEWVNWQTVGVFNPLGWSRGGIVHVELPRGYGPELSGLAAVRGLRDTQSGTEIPLQIVHSDRVGTALSFLAQDVPPLGYRLYELLEQPPAEAEGHSVQVGENTIENEFYRIRVDAQKGVIVSIFDKELDRELVDGTAPHGFNQYIYERPPGGDFKQVWGGEWWVDSLSSKVWQKYPDFERYVPTSARLREGKKGPVSYSLVIEGSAEMTPLVRQEIILHPSVKRIDIVNTLRKEEILAAEAAYFAFPFAVRNPAVRFEGADSIIVPEQEQLPHSARDSYAVQHWVKLSDGAMDILWTPLEAPLVQFGEINTGRWLKTLSISKGFLYSFILSNYWVTNTRPSQGGEMTFRYSLTSQNHSADDVAATRFGWNQMTPFVVAGPSGHLRSWLAPPAARPVPTASGKAVESFCHIADPNVLLITFKAAEEGNGYVLRLLEFSGEPTRTTVRFGPLAVSDVVSLDAAERELVSSSREGASVSEGGVSVSLRPFQLKTLRVLFHP